MTTTLVIRSVYPHDKATEAGKIFLKVTAKTLPPFIKRIEVYVEPSETGIEGYSIYEVEDSKVGEAIRVLSSRMVMFHEVPGYKWRLATVMKAADALPLIGLAPPPK